MKLLTPATPFAMVALAFAFFNFSPAPVRAADTTKSEFELDVEAAIQVRFYNTYESILWTSMRATNAVVKNIGGADEAIQDDTNRWNGYYDWHGLSDIDLRELAKPIRVPNFFAAEDIKALRDLSDKFKAKLNELVATNNALTDYFNSTQSKDDNSKKYREARPHLVELIDQTRENLYGYNNAAIKIAQAGETRILKKSPYGPIILHMREILDLVNQAPPLLTIKSLKGSPYDHIPRTPERKKLATETADKLDALATKISVLLDKYKNDDTSPIDAYSFDSTKEDARHSFSFFYTEAGPGFIRDVTKNISMLRDNYCIYDADRALNCTRTLEHEHDKFVQAFNSESPNGNVAMTRGENSSDDD